MKKRFYKNASIVQSVEDAGFAISLDDKQIKTPAGKPFVVPSNALAGAMAGEWNNQTDEIIPSTMPLTQIAGTAIDRVSETRDGVIDGALGYGQTDLLCHFAENPPELVSRQRDMWQPLLDWAADDIGAKLIPTIGIIPKEQSPDAINAFRNEIEKMDIFSLTGFALLVGACGSLVLALAVYMGRINANQAFECSMLDNTWQIENWGEDWETKDRREAIATEIKDVEKFFDLLRTG